MNSLKETIVTCDNAAARTRLLSLRGDPFLSADWERILFLHFAIEPELLRPFVFPSLKLELYDGRAYVSVVAVTMRRFRPTRLFSPGCVLRPIACQKFLNLRTYVRHRDESGALFLRGWLSKPIPLPLPTFNLPCAFANVSYRHDFQSGFLRGEVNTKSNCFSYRATIDPQTTFESCGHGSLSEFTMERYTGFFHQSNRTRIFRAWHPEWLQTSVDVSINETSLLIEKFNWFKKAKFVGANFAPGFKQVSLGGVHSLGDVRQTRKQGHGASAFFEMP
jgi:uncharacterized protein YqjF (DUF2071 family)